GRVAGGARPARRRGAQGLRRTDSMSGDGDRRWRPSLATSITRSEVRQSTGHRATGMTGWAAITITRMATNHSAVGRARRTYRNTPLGIRIFATARLLIAPLDVLEAETAPL